MGPFFWTDFGGSGDTELEPVRVISYVSAAMYVGGLALIAVIANPKENGRCCRLQGRRIILNSRRMLTRM